MERTSYNGRLISYEDGVISSGHNGELYEALTDFLWSGYGYEFGGGSVEGTLINLNVDTPAATGVREMGPRLKEIFKFGELVIGGLVVN